MTVKNNKTNYRPPTISAILFLIASILTMICGRALIEFGFQLDLWPVYLAIIILIIVAARIGKLGENISINSKLTQQKLRDIRSQNLVNLLEIDPTSSYSLFLRPFKSIGLLTQDIEYFPTPLGSNKPKLDLEIVIAELMEPIAPMIAVKGYSEYIGTGKIACGEEEWRNKVMLLTENAKLIFILPGISDGIIWEIKHIFKSNLLRKCIFIMPPYTSQEYYWEEIWYRLVEEMHKLSVEIPFYQKVGMVFSIGEDNKYDVLRYLKSNQIEFQIVIRKFILEKLEKMSTKV